MSDKLHLLIPGAMLPPGGAPPTWPALPNLMALLAAMVPGERIECAGDSPAMPYEIALARLNGLPDTPGLTPWAAFETGTVGMPCACIKLCHWQVGMDHVTLSPPDDLSLDEATSRALFDAMAPYFLEDGIVLHHQPALPGRFLATGEPFRGLPSTSMDRVAGRRLTREFFETAGAPAAKLRRLQNEMQMLFYTHPANDIRQARGLPPVNSFWVTGAGALERPTPPSPEVRVEARLYAAARRHDAAAHAQAWREADADSCADLLRRLRAGDGVALTLCGDRAAQTFVPAPSGFFQRLARTLAGKPTPAILETL